MGMDRPTLLDIARATDPDGKPAVVHEILNQMNPILQDAPAYPSNAQLAERVTLRGALPTVQFAQLNKGTTISKGTYTQRVDTIAFVDGLSEVDCRLQEVLGTAAVNAHRMREDKGFIEAMNQLVALTILYGNELTAPTEFTGFAPRMASLNATTITGSPVINGAADVAVSGSDGTSIYVVDWGENGAHLIYPRDGSGVAGVKAEDLGKLRVNDADSAPMMAYCTQYAWYVGLTVKDPRHVGRIANIDISDANIEVPTQGQLIHRIIDCLTQMPDPAGMQRVMYTHRRVVAGFQKQALNKSNMALTMENYLNKLTPHFWGVPIRALDQMSAAESTVS